MLRQVRRRFGRRVAHIVEGCTDAFQVPKPPWRERKQQYLEHLHTSDRDTRLVSVADKLHNARSILTDYREIGEPVWRRFAGGREGTLWYYRALLNEFRRGPGNRLVREFERAVPDLEAVVAGGKRSGRATRRPAGKIRTTIKIKSGKKENRRIKIKRKKIIKGH
jgi:hypothetical protein